MYLAPREIAETRNQSLHNFLAASTAWVDAGERMTRLFVQAGRAAVGQLGTLAAPPARLPAPSATAAPVQVIEAAFGILGDANARLLEAAKAQIDACDRLLLTAIDRTAHDSPWEAGLALAWLKSSLQNAENTVHSLTEAAIQALGPVAGPGDAAKP